MVDAGFWSYSVGLLSLLIFVLSWFLLGRIKPFLETFFISMPEARSSHKGATAQGAGLVLVPACLLSVVLLAFLLPQSVPSVSFLVCFLLGVFGFMVLGALDDYKSLDATSRLIIQTVLAALIVFSLPTELRVFGEGVPVFVERIFALIAYLWLINLTNFIDGLDTVTLAWLSPSAFGIGALLLVVAENDFLAGVSFFTLAAMVAFYPFNKPKAQLFLGDSGSLAFGAIWGLLLYAVAAKIGVVQAMLLGAYPVADATMTLIKRFLKGEPLGQAHKSHFYQMLHHKFGFSHGQVGLILFAFQMVCSLCALISATLTPLWGWLGVGLALLVVLIAYMKVEKA